MEVVCLILGPMLALFACFLGFDVITSSFIFIELFFCIHSIYVTYMDTYIRVVVIRVPF